MILILSGEGPSDLGMVEPGKGFKPGPMAVMVDQLLAPSDKLNYSLLEYHASGAECIRFFCESDLNALRHPRPKFFRRSDLGFDSGYHLAGAFQLGKEALKVAETDRSAVLAVFFRDSDGTNSAPRDLWERTFKSMENGFKLSGFDSGVPMVPRPKSEAWILCGLRKAENEHCDCSALENASGNDNSPNSLKIQLEQELGRRSLGPDRNENFSAHLANLVRNGAVRVSLIDLDSFNVFKEVLHQAYKAASAPLD